MLGTLLKGKCMSPELYGRHTWGKRNFMMSVNIVLSVFKGSVSGHLHLFLFLPT